MPSINNPVFEPMPAYMRHLALLGARFIEGNTGDGDQSSNSGNQPPSDDAQEGDETAEGEHAADAEGESDNEASDEGDSESENEPDDEEREENADTSDPETELTEKISGLEKKVETLESDLQAARDENEKLRILEARKLDLKFVPMLTGDNAEAWGKSADSLAELRGDNRPYVDPAQESARNGGDQKSSREAQAQDFFDGLSN